MFKKNVSTIVVASIATIIGAVIVMAESESINPETIQTRQISLYGNVPLKINGTAVTATAAQLNNAANLKSTRVPVTSSSTTAKMADTLVGEYSGLRTIATSTWSTVFTGTTMGFVTVGGVVSTNVATFSTNAVTIDFGVTGVTYNVFVFGAKSN